MIQLHYHPSPNPAKVALFLEEAGLPYEVVPVDTRKGEQFSPAFLRINPNAKTPALVDGDAVVFDSNAILLHLAERTGRFGGGEGAAARGELLSWLMLIATGVGPYAGQCVHFRHFAPAPKDYAVARYLGEAKRHFGLLDARLATREWLVGDAYSIVDMAAWGWSRAVPFVLGNARDDLSVWEALPHLKRHLDAISARPAAARAEALKDAHAYKTTFDEDAKRHLFPHTAGMVAG